MKKYKILSVKDENLKDCADIIRKAFSKSANEYGFTKENYPSSGAFITEKDLAEAKQKGIFMYAAWVDEKIAGYVQLEQKSQDIFSFQKFSVPPEFQQLGIGKSLILFCKNKTLVSGGKKLQLIMVDKNKDLKEMYEANGFKVTGYRTDEAHPFLQAIMEMDIIKDEVDN